MSRLIFWNSPIVTSLLAVVGTVSLAACHPIEFEPDPDGGDRTPVGEQGEGGTGGSRVGPETGGGGGLASSDGGSFKPAPNTLHFGRVGFCIAERGAIELRLARNAEGLMSVEGTYAALAPNTGEPCPTTGGLDPNCVVPVPFPSYTLNQAQQAQLDRLLEALPVGVCLDNYACDRCVVPTLEMDARTETTCCGEAKTPGFDEAFNNVEKFLDSLVPQRAAFELFRLRRGPGMGFCVDPGQGQDVSFRRDSDGSLSLSGRVVQLQLGAGELCPKGTEAVAGTACVSTIPTTKLSADQQSTLERMIAALPAGRCEPVSNLECDPCAVTTYDIDARTESSPCCGTQGPSGFSEAFKGIGDYVDSLLRTLVPRSDTIRLYRSAALGFCVEKGQAIDVTLRREGGVFAMSGSYAVGTRTSAAQCPSGTTSVRDEICVGTLSPVVLSADETAKLDALVTAMPASQCVESPGLECDPCVIPMLDIGSRSETEDCCGTQQSPGYTSAFNAVSSYIDGLVRQRSSF